MISNGKTSYIPNTWSMILVFHVQIRFEYNKIIQVRNWYHIQLFFLRYTKTTSTLIINCHLCHAWCVRTCLRPGSCTWRFNGYQCWQRSPSAWLCCCGVSKSPWDGADAARTSCRCWGLDMAISGEFEQFIHTNQRRHVQSTIELPHSYSSKQYTHTYNHNEREIYIFISLHTAEWIGQGEIFWERFGAGHCHVPIQWGYF